MAERRCLMTSYPTNCTVGCYKCNCGGEVALNDYYVSIYDVQRVCDIEGVAAETEEGCEIAEVIRNNLEQMAVVKADVQPVKRGRWIKDEKGVFHHCSECGGETFRDVDSWGLECQEYCTDYCHHCGAKMDGGADDENSN